MARQRRDGVVTRVTSACGRGAPEQSEMCGNDDDDCDGLTDEDCNCDYRCECVAGEPCVCAPPTNQPSLRGPFATGGVGSARAGGATVCRMQRAASHAGACSGQVLPGVECEAGAGANGTDDDCDGIVDDGCADVDGDGARSHPTATTRTRPFIRRDRDVTIATTTATALRTRACARRGAARSLPPTHAATVSTTTATAVDDGCTCAAATQNCYRGPSGTAGVALLV